MATIQKDAKLLTQESLMIVKIQGEEYADYGIDAYIEKLSKMTKRKLKIYQYLDEKAEQFMKVFKEEDERRINV